MNTASIILVASPFLILFAAFFAVETHGQIQEFAKARKEQRRENR